MQIMTTKAPLLPLTTSIPSIETITPTKKTKPGIKVKTKSPSSIDTSFYESGRPKQYPLFVTVANNEFTPNDEEGKGKNILLLVL